MHVLVTGNQGYIGAVMVRVLQEHGHTVTGLDSGYFKDCILGQPPADVPTVYKDIRDVTSQDLEGIEAVVHLAALSNDPLGNVDETWTYDINYTASTRLAELAREAGIERFIYASSCSMYGVSNEGMLTEDNAFNPLTPYARSKVKTEEAIFGLANDHFSPISMRNATAYGFSPRLRADIVLNNLVAWAYTTGKIRILSDGTPWRPIVHIEDISRATAALLSAPRELVHNQAFNVGRNSENYQVRDLAEIVKTVMPECQIEYAPDGSPDPRSYRVDFSKLEALPGYDPQWDALRGARELYDAYRAAGLTRADFEGRRYVRLRHLQHLIDNGLLDANLRWQQPEAHS